MCRPSTVALLRPLTSSLVEVAPWEHDHASTTLPSARITAEVTSWPGVEAGHGRRGEWAFTSAAARSATSTATTPRTSASRKTSSTSSSPGRIVHHPVFPDRRGPAARRIEDDADVEDVIALLRDQYERALSRS